MTDYNPPPRPDTTVVEEEEPGIIKKEPVTILFIVLVVAQALITGLGIGELEDGFQAGDIIAFGTAVVIGIATRMNVFAPATVDLMADRATQKRAIAARKAGTTRAR